MDQEQVLQVFKEKAVRPLAFEEVAALFASEPLSGAELSNILKELEAQGDLVLTRKNLYALPTQLNLYVGRINRHAKGFGFLTMDDPEDEDLFVPINHMNGAMNQDKVMVRIRKPASTNATTGINYRAEGEVIRILERHNTRVLGTFEKGSHYGFVVPDDKRFGGDIFVPQNAYNGAKTGAKVIIEITKWPEPNRSAEGRINEIIGYIGDTGIDVISVIYKHNLRHAFPKKVRKAVETLPDHVSSGECRHRQDFRHLPLVTIDGADAKDLDDAVYIERLPNGHFSLGVHIADVGHYVPEGSEIDKEAFARATSVYLVDRVLPMLPEALSNGICSLNAGVDRLALSCLMEVDGQGQVVSHQIVESVIHVQQRLTYTLVNELLAGDDPALCLAHQDLLPMLQAFATLQNILEEKRHRRGAVTFDIPESGVILDEAGHPIELYWRNRGIGEKIIEECMLLANETVAEHYEQLNIPFLYRVHEEPDPEKFATANNFLQIFGYQVKVGSEGIRPQDYQRAVDKFLDTPHAKTLSMVLLRSMRHARYAPEPLGHFGLAARHYSHFTSPIRRYPDLAIHRIIKETIRSGSRLSKKRYKDLTALVAKYADHASQAERTAEEAERESVDMKKVEYMLPRIGESFLATISSVTSFGFFVQLENSVEGLVHISTLVDDFYLFDQDSCSLLGGHTKRQYRLGESIEVKLVRVSVEERRLDFEVFDQGLPPHKNASKVKAAIATTAKKSTKNSKKTPKAAPALQVKPAAASNRSKSRRSRSKRRQSGDHQL